jgi:hypothetical protein
VIGHVQPHPTGLLPTFGTHRPRPTPRQGRSSANDPLTVHRFGNPQQLTSAMNADMRRLLVRRLNKRINEFAATKNGRAVMHPAALHEAMKLIKLAQRTRGKQPPFHCDEVRVVAFLHIARSFAGGHRATEHHIATTLFALLYHADPRHVPEPLHPEAVHRLSMIKPELRMRVDISYGLAMMPDIISRRRQPINPHDGIDLLARSLMDRGLARLRRYEFTRDIADLEAGVTLTRRSVEEATNPALRSLCQSNLGIALRKLQRQLGQPTLLDEAIDALHAAVRDGAPAQPNYQHTRFELAEALADRHELDGNQADLDAAIQQATDLASAAPPSDDHTVIWWSAVARWRGRRFGRTGDSHDLDAEIAASTAALENAPATYRERPSLHANPRECDPPAVQRAAN